MKRILLLLNLICSVVVAHADDGQLLWLGGKTPVTPCRVITPGNVSFPVHVWWRMMNSQVFLPGRHSAGVGNFFTNGNIGWFE